jgi:hypothetical protein
MEFFYIAARQGLLVGARQLFPAHQPISPLFLFFVIFFSFFFCDFFRFFSDYFF